MLKASKPLVIGFLPEADCAPIVVAQEFGLYEKYGLNVTLQREQIWRSIQDNITQRRLQAAHAPATLPFLMNLGLTPERCSSVCGLILSLQGNGIVISRDLWNQGAHDADSFGRHVMRDKQTYTFGVGSPLGPQYSLLCQWLRAAEIPYRIKIRIELTAPHEMFPLLKMGYLDGFCAGEPWTSLAVHAGIGAWVTGSAELAPLHPEKVLLVRKDFAHENREAHERLIAALMEACAMCDEESRRRELCEMLAAPRYVNAPVECLEVSLARGAPARDRQTKPRHGAPIFHRARANDPTAAKAAWVTGRLYAFLRWGPRPPGLHQVFRRSIFLRAQTIASQIRPGPLGQTDKVESPLACAG